MLLRRRRLVYLLSCDNNITLLGCAVRGKNAPGKIRKSPSEGGGMCGKRHGRHHSFLSSRWTVKARIAVFWTPATGTPKRAHMAHVRYLFRCPGEAFTLRGHDKSR